MSDFCQQPNEQTHALNARITTLVNNCRFQDHQTTEKIKLMLPQYTVKFHKARDWIRLQDQSQLTYTTLLQHCKTFEQNHEQFQKAQIKGHAELTTLSAATAAASSVYQDTITTHSTQCMKCGYKNPQGNCPATGKECYNCHGTGHYTTLCRCLRYTKNARDRHSWSHQRRPSSHRQSSHSSRRHRQFHHRSTYHNP